MQGPQTAHWRKWMFILPLLLLGASYWLGITSRANVIDDDGHYLALSHSIAHGLGYRAMWAEGHSIELGIPPAYPGLLAPIWWLFPSFPDNIFALKALNVIFALGTVVFTYLTAIRAFKLQRWQAYLASCVVAFSQLHIAFLDLTMIETSLACCLLVSLLGICEITKRTPEAPGKTAWGLGILAAGPCYLKKSAFPLLVAVCLWLWFSGQRRLASASAAAMGILLLPWFLHRQIWSSGGGTVVQNVTMLGPRPPDQISAIERIITNLWEITSTSIPYSVTPLFPSLSSWGPWVGPVLTGIVLAGFVRLVRVGAAPYAWFTGIYLFIVTFINTWETVRFTMLLTPIFALAWVAATTGPLAALLLGRPARARWIWPGAIILALVPISLAGAASKRFVAVFTHPPYHDALLPPAEHHRAEDQKALLAWEKNQKSPTALWVSAYPKGLYLLTGRTTTSFCAPPDPSPELLQKLRKRPHWILLQEDPLHPRTFTNPRVTKVLRSADELNACMQEWVAANPSTMTLLFASPHGYYRIYQP
jgi:hypothetical protein